MFGTRTIGGRYCEGWSAMRINQHGQNQMIRLTKYI